MLLSFVSILILCSILIFYLSEWIEKRSQLFLFKKFKARFDKSIKLFNDHAPVQQEFLEYLYNDWLRKTVSIDLWDLPEDECLFKVAQSIPYTGF